MFRDAALIAGKDLRIEWRSRVTVNQVVPFALVVLVLFAFALDPDRGTLRVATPGLFWIAVLFTAVLAVQRSFNIEVADAGRDGLRLSGLDPAGIFLGKAGALALQLLALEATLGVGVAILYGTASDPKAETAGVLPVSALLVAAALFATIGLAATGALYGALAAGLRVRDTLLPLLFLPTVSPVMIGATRAFESALRSAPGNQLQEGWPWVGLLAGFAGLYVALGLLAFGALLEEA
jgi:heme exporter protein B